MGTIDSPLLPAESDTPAGSHGKKVGGVKEVEEEVEWEGE